MIDSAALEIAAQVLLSGVLATVVAVLLGVPIGGWFAGGRPGRSIVRSMTALTRVAVPIAVVTGLVFQLLGVEITLTSSRVAVVVVQVLGGLIITAGSTAQAIRLLPSNVTEQLDALRLDRAQRVRLSIVEVWPDVMGGAVKAFASVVAFVGAILAGGGRLAGETRITSPVIRDGIGQSSEIGAGLLLIGLSVLVVTVLLSVRRTR